MSNSQTKLRYIGAAGAGFHARREVPDRSIMWIARDRAKKLQPFIRSTDVVLEHGCGSGWNLAALNCSEKLAHDIAPSVRPHLDRLGLKFVANTGEIPDGSVDAVISHHCLEHVPDPSAVLAECRRLLKPDGRLLLTVPYEFDRKSRIYRGPDDWHHIFSWTGQTLGNLVSDHGFTVQSMTINRRGNDTWAAVHSARFGEWVYIVLLKMRHYLTPGWEIRLIALAQ